MRVYKIIYVSKWFRLRVCCFTLLKKQPFAIAACFIHVVLLLYSSLFAMRLLQPSSSCSTSFSPTHSHKQQTIYRRLRPSLIYGCSQVQGPATAAAYVYNLPSCIQLLLFCLFHMTLDLSVVESHKCPYILYKDALRCATFDKETGWNAIRCIIILSRDGKRICGHSSSLPS